MRGRRSTGHLRRALGLAVLAPLVAEVVASSNTPAVLFPVLLPLLVVIYGLPALLVRELWVRRGIGRFTAVVLGVGYTALNEGLVAATWFKLDPDDGRVLVFTATEVGRSAGVSWVLVAGLTLFHAVWSLLIPISLMEVWTARTGAGVPWLGWPARLVAGGLIAFVMLGSLSVKATDRVCEASTRAIFDECASGRRGAAALTVAATVVALVAPRRTGRPRPADGRRRPGDATLRWVGAGYAVAFLVAFFALPLAGRPWASVALSALLGALVLVVVPRWARAPDWDARAVVALCTGALIPGMVTSLRGVLVLQPVAVAAFVWWFLRPLHARARSLDL